MFTGDLERRIDDILKPDYGAERERNGIVVGSPDSDVHGVGVTWLPPLNAMGNVPLDNFVRYEDNFVCVHAAKWIGPGCIT